MKHWLAAYVRLHHEKKTRDRLLSMGIECFLPIQEEMRQWSDRRKKVQLIVLPMIIFVRVDISERMLPLSLSAVLRYMVLRGESSPVVIPDVQMDRFRFMLDYSEETIEMCAEPLVPGEWVKVIKGPLAGLEGELLMMNGKSKVAIRLNMLGVAQVNIPTRYVERITAQQAKPLGNNPLIQSTR